MFDAAPDNALQSRVSAAFRPSTQQGLRQHILCITFALPSHHLHTEPGLALVDVTAHEHLAAAATYICQLHTHMSWSPTMPCCEKSECRLVHKQHSAQAHLLQKRQLLSQRDT